MPAPKTMDELLVTLYDMPSNHVIPTVATHQRQYLRDAHVTAAQAYHAHAMALGNSIGNQAPGEAVKITKQTDLYYRDLDGSGTFQRLSGLALDLARRIR